MEDFGFKLQDITKNNLLSKKIIKFILFLIASLLLILISIKIIKEFVVEINVNDIPLIKAQSKSIKELPKDSGGLVVDNLNINVYDVIDNKDNENINPIINKTKQNIDIVDNISNDILTDQEMLANKINEIQNNDEFLMNSKTSVSDAANNNNDNQKIIDNNIQENQINKIQQNTQNKDKKDLNIKINSEKNKIKTNINSLKKLGNQALIDNLKNHKDIKPGIKVQLLALKSKNGIIEYWENLNNKYNTLFKDKNYYIESVNLDNVGNIYRLQVGMFNNEDEARNFCSKYIKLANKNKIDCIIINN